MSNDLGASDDMADLKKDSILERLNKRNKERQNYLDVRLEQRNKENVHLEGADYFAQSFAEGVRKIESLLQSICDAATANQTTNGNASVDFLRLFTETTLEIQELQRYLTNSTMFLTDFKIKACQNALNDLQNNCDELRLRLLPKKKFGFSGKKVAPKALVNPKVSNGSDKVDTPEKTLATTGGRAGFTWTLSNRQHEYICLQGDAVNGQDVTIAHLKHCFVELQGHAGSVQLSHITDCTILCGPIARSMFAEHCEDSTLAMACQQLRLHSSSKCHIYMHVTCRAIIEDCTQIDVSDYHYTYGTAEEDFQLAALDKTKNNYTDVADFNWLSPDVPSPNWRLLKDCPEPNWIELRARYQQQQQQQQKQTL